MAFAQHLTFGSGKFCDVGTDICSATTTDKIPANVQMHIDAKTGELVLILNSKQLELANRQKLLATRSKSQKDTYQYTFTYDNPLPPDIVQYLGLSGTYFIMQGTYPVIIQKELIILRVKLIRK